MGLWHGANWTFAIWGLYHAMLIQAQRLTGRKAEVRGATAAREAAGFAVTLPLMMAGWVPFRCQSVGDAFTMWGRMLDPSAYGVRSLGLSPNSYLVAAAVFLGMLAVWGWSRFAAPALARRALMAPAIETAYYAATFTLVILCLQVKDQFIYFQF